MLFSEAFFEQYAEIHPQRHDLLSVVGDSARSWGPVPHPPGRLIGDEGMGTYQLVFPTYNMLLTISSAGLPVAISRMVSFTLARDDPATPGASSAWRCAFSPPSA